MHFKKILVSTGFIFALLSFQPPAGFFSGEIVLQYQFKDAQGRDITDKMAAVLGRGQHYFVNEKNYKAYDETNRLVQLYNSSTNAYYEVTANKEVHKIDASVAGSKTFTVQKSAEQETIAGYACRSIVVLTDDFSTTYFFTPLIKVDRRSYAHHNFGDWNKILEATGGALPLKYKIVFLKQAFMQWTMTATSVVPKKLKDDDFQAPSTSH